MYTPKYFIDFFSQIPDNKWGDDINQGCALFHLGVTHDPLIGYIQTEQSQALINLFGGNGSQSVYEVNDGTGTAFHKGNTPKERILNKLKSLSV